MDKGLPTESIMQEFLYILQFLGKASVIIGILGVFGGLYICAATSETNCFLKTVMLIFGTLEIVIGIMRFLFYSSFSSGFDAIWTPQMQGEIQRDERKRQITGWSRATTGGTMIVVGISTLMLYISVFV